MSSDPTNRPADSAEQQHPPSKPPGTDPSTVETHGWGSSVDGLRISGPNSQGLKIRCPHCHNPIEIVADDSLQELTCPSCGSNFSLIEGQSNTTSAQPTVRKLGQFELIEQLGVGAFGSVWKARDTELDRVVAIKIPRKDQLGPDEVEQFFREARAAAQLRHPNIVSVHEVGREGTTVYIVSDLIRGVTLTDWLTGQQPTPRETAAICAQIAAALNHAHERGVIHRDLKPGNVMLDGDGQVHIMDFGLAKREAGEITMTVEGRILGTPAYMSPEQARGEGHTVDRRTDVYSLGVILFQLLTGELPFRGTPRMLLHQVLSDEPRLPRSLNDRVPRDLETICLKAMAKEPSRRYETTQAFADDLNRWLKGEPILARPVGRMERAWRWVKRNPQAALAIVSLLLSLIVLLMVIDTQLARREADGVRAKQEADRQQAVAANERALRQRADENVRRAEAAEAAASAEAENAKRAADFLAGLFQSSDPLGLFGQRLGPTERVGLQATALDLLKFATLHIDREFADQPLAKAELFDNIGSVIASYGKLDEAEPFLRKGLELRTQQLGDRHSGLVPSLQHLAIFHFLEGDYRAAEDRGRQALALSLADSRDQRLERATSQLVLGFVVALSYLTAYEKTDAKEEETETLLRAAISTRRIELGVDHRDTLLAESILVAAFAARTNRRLEGLALASKVASAMQRSSGDKPFSDFLAALQKATAAGGRRKYDDARQILENEITRMQTVFGQSHFLVDVLRDNLTWIYRASGQDDATEKLYRDAIASTLAQVGERPIAADRMCKLAEFLGQQGKLEERRQLIERAIEIRRKRFGADSPLVAELQVRLDNELLERAYQANRAGNTDEAESLFRQAAEKLAVQGEAGRVDLARALFWQANLTRNKGRITESIPLFEKSRDVFRAALGNENLETARCEMDLGIAFNKMKNGVKGQEWLSRAYRSYSQAPKHDLHLRLLCARELSISYFLQRRIEPAVKVYDDELTLRRSIFGPDDPAVAQAEWLRSVVLLELSRPEEAIAGLEHCIKCLGERKDLGDQTPAIAQWYLATAYDSVGQKEKSLQARQGMLDAIDATSNALALHLAVWAGALRNDLPERAAQVLEMARRAVSEEPQQPGHRAVLALALTRTQASEEALAALVESKELRKYSDWSDQLLTVLAKCQLGKIDEARSALREYEAVVRKARLAPLTPEARRGAPLSWDHKYLARLLYQEAQNALRKAPGGEYPDTEQWPVLFRDDFPEPKLSPSWKPALGACRLINHALELKVAPQAKWNMNLANVSLDEPVLPDTLEIRCRVRHPGRMGFLVAFQNRDFTLGQLVELSNEPNPVSKYQGLTVYEQPGQEVYLPAYHDESVAWHAAEPREVRVLRHDDQITVTVDGQLLATVGVLHIDQTRLLLQAEYGAEGEPLTVHSVEIRAP